MIVPFRFVSITKIGEKMAAKRTVELRLVVTYECSDGVKDHIPNETVVTGLLLNVVKEAANGGLTGDTEYQADDLVVTIKTIGVQNPDPKPLPDVDMSDDAWLGKK